MQSSEIRRFVGENTIISNVSASLSRLAQGDASESHGNADLVAHFFRRAFSPAAGRRFRPDRHEHDRPGRHANDWACAGSGKHGGEIYLLRRSAANGLGGGGRGQRRACDEGRLCRAHGSSTSTSVETSPPFSSTWRHDDPATHWRQARGIAFRRQSSLAWASPSTTPIRQASLLRSPRCSELIAEGSAQCRVGSFHTSAGEEINAEPDACSLIATSSTSAR